MAESPFELLKVQRQRVNDLRAELAREQHKLEGMEEMFGAFPTSRRRSGTAAAVAIGALTMPAPRFAGGGPPITGSAGRQPGSISKKWRDVLAELWRAGSPFVADQAADIVRRLEDRPIKPSEAKRVLESYQEHGYIVRNGAGEFIVTDDAASRFGFARPASPGDDNTGVGMTMVEPGTAADLIGDGVERTTMAQPRMLTGGPPAGIGSKGWWDKTHGSAPGE